MKKVALGLMVIYCVMLLTSCTDTTNELEEKIEYEKKLIDKDEIIIPTDKGKK